METAPEKIKKGKPPGLKIALGIIGVFVLLIIGFSIWLFRPIKKVPSWELVPPKTFCAISFNLDSKSPGMTELMSRAQKAVLSKIGFAKRAVLRLMFPSLKPKYLMALITANSESKKAGVVFVADMDKAIRLIKLFEGTFERTLFRRAPVTKELEKGQWFKSTETPSKRIPVSAYSILKNNLVLGSTLSLVKDSSRRLREEKTDVPTWEDILILLLQKSRHRDGFMFVDNSEGDFSRIIQSLEGRFAYAVFPSIDSVAMIMGHVDLSQKGAGNVIVSFRCRGPGKVRDVASDVRFMYGALRRMLKPRGITLKGKIRTEGNTVTLDLEFSI